MHRQLSLYIVSSTYSEHWIYWFVISGVRSIIESAYSEFYVHFIKVTTFMNTLNWNLVNQNQLDFGI